MFNPLSLAAKKVDRNPSADEAGKPPHELLRRQYLTLLAEIFDTLRFLEKFPGAHCVSICDRLSRYVRINVNSI